MISAANMGWGWLPNAGASGGGGGSGTVTSVALDMPASVFAVTGSPITTSGTFDVSFQTQAANTVFAGPATGADDAPTFRALVAADIPTGIVLLSRLGAADATNTIDNANFAQTWQWNTLAAQTAFTWSSSSISSGVLFNISISSTAAASNTQTGLLVSTAGANGTASQTTYAARFINTHTGTSSLNIAARFIASGGSSNTAVLANVGGSVAASTLYSTITVQEDAIGAAATSIRGIALVNATAAAAGAQQYSPSIIFRAQGWSTNSGGASNTIDWRWYATAVQGSSVASSVLNLGISYNGGSFTEYFTFTFTSSAVVFTAPNISMLGTGQFLTASSGATNSDIAAFGQSIGTSADSRVTFAGAASVNMRSLMMGTAVGITVANSYASHIIGATDITEAASGTHALIASLVVKPQTITGGAATVTNTATVYIESAMTCTVTGANYAMWVASGTSRFDGNILFAAGTTTQAPATFQTGSLLTTPTAGSWGYSTPGLYFTNGTAVRQQVVLAQMTRVSGSNFSVSDSTLVNVTGLTANVAAGATYEFEIVIYGTCDITGGMQIALAGTCTATSIIYQGQFGEAGGNVQYAPRATALGTGIAMGSGSTAPYLKLTGTITVNAAGTLTVQMAEEVTTATATVLIGSTFKVTQIN